MDQLHHYCSTDAFVSVVKTKSLWLSSLTLGNDTTEGRLVKATLQRLGRRDNLSDYYVELLGDSVARIEQHFDGLGFCLSASPDLLSQWRGYAANGTGVCIGFRADYLDALVKSSAKSGTTGCTLRRVLYAPEEHEAALLPAYRELKKLIDDGALQPKSLLGGLLNTSTPEQRAVDEVRTRKLQAEFFAKTLLLFGQLFDLKDPAFQEERESRLLSFLLSGFASDACDYRAVGPRIVPYRAYPLPDPENAISSLILGPKHETPTEVIKDFLARNGFKNVEIQRSRAPYR